MRTAPLVFAVVVGLSLAAGSAAGDSNPRLAATSLLAAQTQALGSGDAKAFAATFATNSFAFLPTAAEGNGRAAIEKATAAWMRDHGKIIVKTEKVVFGTLNDEPDWAFGAWYHATLVVSGATTTRWRLTAVVGMREALDREDTVQDYRVVAAHLSEAVDDKAAFAAAAAGKLPALPSFGIADEDRMPDDDWQPHRVAAWAKRVHKDAAAVLVGSAPKELFVGKAKVAAALGKWKSLELATIDAMRFDEPDMQHYTVVMGHVTGTFRVAGKAIKVPYRVLMVTANPPAAAETPSTLAVAHFSIATR